MLQFENKEIIIINRIMLIRKITKRLKPRFTHPTSSFNLFLYSQIPKINPNKDYYSILDVPKDASIDQIQSSYSKLAHIYDPSINPSHRDIYNDLNQAKQILINEKMRKQYDKERFYVKFNNEMNDRFQRQNEQPYETKKTDRYSFELTPEEDEVLYKTKRFFKRVLIVGVGLAIFLPFVLWRGGDQAPAVNEAGYPIRPSSQHRAELARIQYEQEQMQQAYQQRYPNASPSSNLPYPQGPQQSPNVIVTGQFVTD